MSGTWEGNTFIPDVVPLLRPLNLVPGGDILARALDPPVREIVDAGYKDNTPYRRTRPSPGRWVSGFAETTTC